MAHYCWHFTSDTTILPDAASQNKTAIENVWKSCFQDGECLIRTTGGILLEIPDKIIVSICQRLNPMSSIASNNFMACELLASEDYENSANSSAPNDTAFWSSFAMAYGANLFSGIASTGTVLNSDTYLHMITSKTKKSVMVGVGDSPSRIMAQVLVSQVDADNYLGIQLGVNYHDKLYTYRANSYEIYNAGNDRYDGYVKDDLKTTVRTPGSFGPGRYISDNLLTIVPAINPWSGAAIPDVYVSVTGPYNKTGLDGVINIGNRQFMTGHTFSNAGSGAITFATDANKYISDGGTVTFLEV